MKLLFTLEDEVHQFKVTGEIGEQDLSVLRQSLFRFFETNPTFTVLDLSEVSLQVTDLSLQNLLTEVKSLANSKALHLAIAQTDIETKKAKQFVLEAALLKQVEILKGKLELREKMRIEAEKILKENESLKATMEDQLQKMASIKKEQSLLNPLIEKLWSEK